CMADNLIEKLLAQAATIKAAPVPFALVVVGLATGVWVVFNYSYSTILSSKNAQLELADRQIADYKQKLGGASPDEARARMDELEKGLKALTQQIKVLQPRRLTAEQRHTIIERSRSLSGRPVVAIEYEGTCPDCTQYANDFVLAFND